MDPTNGHARGRRVPPLRQYTFLGSGVTVGLRRLGRATQAEIAQAVRAAWRQAPDGDPRREPQPPIPAPPPAQDGVMVDVPLLEPNRADPDYVAAHAAWERAQLSEIMTKVLHYAGLVCVEVEVDPVALARVRAGAKAVGLPLDEDPEQAPDDRDRVLYLRRVVFEQATDDELIGFYQALTSQDMPTEQEVADALATFRPPVGRDADPDRDSAAAAGTGEPQPPHGRRGTAL